MSSLPKMDILLAGFGGQGVLFAGKVIATAGLIENREVSWLPSYGPEMRGGTANCSVCLDDEAIGSPMVTQPSVFLAMNQPSFDKFIDDVVKGGIVIADSTMVFEVALRDDIALITLEATKLAEDAGLAGLANMVMIGRLFAAQPFCEQETLDAAIDQCVPPRKAALIAKNKEAIALGMIS